MQSYVHFVCGFNGFDQFTDLIHSCYHASQSEALPSRPKTESELIDVDTNLALVNLVAFQNSEYFSYSWSSVFACDDNEGDYRQYGFSHKLSRKLNFVFPGKQESEMENTGRCIGFEYPDCPRGFHCQSMERIVHRKDFDRFYLIDGTGVYNARIETEDNTRQHSCIVTRFIIPGNNSIVKYLSCGKEHVLLLTSTGEVYSFGAGSRGQLGIGCLESRIDPTVIEPLQPLNVVMIAAGGWHSLALTGDGDVYAWGWNQSGQLGIGCFPSDDPLSEQRSCTDAETCHRSMFCTLPVLVDFKQEVTKISCGTRHSAAILTDRTLWTWGWNGYGQLGLGDTNDQHCPTVVQKLLSGCYAVNDVVCNSWNTVVRASR